MTHSILETGLLEKTKEPYFIRVLENTPYDLAASNKLQTSILKLLDSGQTLIHLQDEEGFSRRRDGVSAITLGVFVRYINQKNPKLVAQQTLELSADPMIPLVDGLEPHQVGCAEGFMVHPEYRGNRLTDILLRHMHRLGTEIYGKKAFMSCVDASNPFSYNVLFKNGYGITHAYVDEVDGGKTYAFLNQTAMPMATSIQRPKVEAGHFEDVQEVLQKYPQPVIIYQEPQRVCTHERTVVSRPHTFVRSLA